MAIAAMNLVLLGECGHGKSSIVNFLRKPGANEAAVGRRADGVTKAIALYSMPEDWMLQLVDTPGIGSGRISLARLTAEIEAVLSGAKCGPVRGIVVTCPASSPRVMVGTQIAKALAALGFQGDDDWKHVILVATKCDRADAEDTLYFRSKLAPAFFEGSALVTPLVAMVSHSNYEPLLDAIGKLPREPLAYRLPDAGRVSEMVAKLLGHEQHTFEAELVAARRQANGAIALVGGCSGLSTADARPERPGGILGDPPFNGRHLERNHPSIVPVNHCQVLQQLQDGPGQQMDALILQGVDGQALNNLTPAPLAICSIGLLMCLSITRDFSLHVSGKSRTLLEHPDSFRATLCQIAQKTHTAFMTAHGNMHELGLLMDGVPVYLQATVMHLLNPSASPKEVAQEVGEELEAVDRIGQKCCDLAESTHSQFERVLEFLWEMQELLVANRGASEEKLASMAVKKQFLQERQQLHENQKKSMKEEFDRMSQHAEDARSNLKKVFDARPSTDDLVGAAFADAGCAVLRGMAAAVTVVGSFGMSLLAKGSDQSGQGPDDAFDVRRPSVDATGQANARVAPLAEELVGHAKALREAVSQGAGGALGRPHMAKQLEVVQSAMMKLIDAATEDCDHSGLARDIKRLAEQLEQPLMDARRALDDGDSDICARVLAKVSPFANELMEVQVKAASVLQAGFLPPRQFPAQGGETGQRSKSSGGSMMGMVDTWEFQMQAATQLLIQAECRRMTEFEKIQDLSRKMLEENQRLSRLQLKELSLDEVLKIVQGAISQLCKCKEAWARLVQFFMYISELTKFCAKKQLVDFAALSSAVSDDARQGDPFTQSLKDQLYQIVIRTSQSAFAAGHLARVYHGLSRAHFLEPLACLGRIFTLSMGPELEAKRKQLMQQCQIATEAIGAKVEEQRSTTRTQIHLRIGSIQATMQEHIGKPDPNVQKLDLQKLVHKAVQDVAGGGDYTAPSVVTIDLDETDLI